MRTLSDPRRYDRLEIFRSEDEVELIIWPAWPTMQGTVPVSNRYFGPTIHHALVAACFTFATAKLSA